MFLSLKLALSSLRAHRLRAILAMLGVCLGALALTGVQHVAMAMVRKAEVEVQKLGPNLLAARSGQVRFTRVGTSLAGASKTFRLDDAQALATQLPGVVLHAPYIDRTVTLRAADRKIPATVVATWPSYQQVRNAEVQAGRFFTAQEEQERAKVMVLGPKIAQRLFGSEEQALGQSVFYFRAGFRVIGVMQARGRDLSGADQDEQVLVPLSTYMRRAANQDWITGVYMQLAPGADPESVRTLAEGLMRARHNINGGRRDDFTIQTARETIRLQAEALGLVQTLGLISSSVSFAVGGLGILSIMVLMVRQRRVEIGIRRALGARKADIVRQFLLEAGLMSGVGGAVGVVASLAVVTAVYRFGEFPAVYDPLLILGSLAGSGLLGLLAGAYPAWRAAEVEILDVLKNE